MKKIVFITSQNLSEWNYKRFGLEILSNYFDVEYWNVEKLHSKQSLAEKNDFSFKDIKIINFQNYYQLMKESFRQNKDHFLIDLSSNEDFLYIIAKNLMISKGSKELSISTGAYVETQSKYKNKFSIFFKKLKYKNYFKFLLRSRLNKLKSYLIIRKYYHYFINGNLNETKKNKENITLIHAVDYNLYLNLKNKSVVKDKYIAYLDQKLIEHPEFEFLNTPNFYDKKFYHYLELFFKKIEKFYNRKVIFCAHPRAKKKDEYLKNFNNVVFNESAYYSMNSDFVIAHDSVSLNFPILFKKPILLVNVPGMELSDKLNNLKVTSEILDCGLTDIDNFNFDENITKNEINDKKYNDYIKKYIKYGGEEINSWEIISKKLLEI